ncbi:hypothetical protein B566_EDAN015967 [Ephemera danica]|nr:hypothetical protein B566_EDAN015967 [Ephemera danica]
MEVREEPLLEEGPTERFRGATLQIHHDSNQGSRSPSSQGTYSPLKQAAHPGYGSLCPVAPSTEEEAREFFVSRDNLVTHAVEESVQELLQPESDGELLGSWLLTEISLWDTEKERLILLSSRVLIIVKYDFIALKRLDHRKIPLTLIDTLVIGELIYPPGSLVPRLNGLASGVVTVVKGCLLRPLQERWAAKQTCEEVDQKDQFCQSTFEYFNFEPRARNVRGVRAMWNRDEGNKKFDVEDFAQKLSGAVEQASSCNGLPSCKVENAPIVLQNYVGLGSLIHNRNALGFFKVRGKFSF